MSSGSKLAARPLNVAAPKAWCVCAVKQSRFGTLKKVSGKLRKMWTGRDESASPEEAMPRLLVVDDEESICFSMSEYFSLHGFKVDTARELDDAEKLKHKEHQDFVDPL